MFSDWDCCPLKTEILTTPDLPQAKSHVNIARPLWQPLLWDVNFDIMIKAMPCDLPAEALLKCQLEALLTYSKTVCLR